MLIVNYFSGGQGINMTINTNSTNAAPSTVVVQPSTIFMSTSSDVRPPSGGGGGGSGGGAGGIVGCGVTTTATSSVLASTTSEITNPNISSEPVAGPSGLGPVQSVPLVSCCILYLLTLSLELSCRKM